MKITRLRGKYLHPCYKRARVKHMSAYQAYAGDVSLVEIQAQEAVLAEFCAGLDPDALPLGDVSEAPCLAGCACASSSQVR